MTAGYDCVLIPGALQSATGNVQGKDKICGRSAGLVTANGGAASKTVCSKRCPFAISFLSDSFEFIEAAISEAAKTNKGFRLAYIQTGNNC